MDALEGVEAPLRRRARDAAMWIRGHRNRTVTVVHHVDADGVTAGAVAVEALARAGVEASPLAVRSLDGLHVSRILDGGPEALWFADLGSAAHMHFRDIPRMVCDHHVPVRDGTEESFPHVNPVLDGIGGGTVSGAGCAFLVAAELDPANADLLPLALVGAAADLQDRDGGFKGTDAALVVNGAAAGRLEVERDLAWFGCETRPLERFLAYGSEPAVPTVTGDRRGAAALLEATGVKPDQEGRERTWAALDDGERRRIRGALVERVLHCGLGAGHADGLFRDVVRIEAEAAGSPTRELREFATLLNGTARYGRPEVGLAVARGDRDGAYREALELLTGHRRHLSSALDAFAQAGVTEARALQWVHLGDQVRDTVVGTVCGMALAGLGLRRDLVLVGLANAPDGLVKASGRAPAETVLRGADLSQAMQSAAAAVGGQGGGHAGAAGATFPGGEETAFLEALDACLLRQIQGRTAL